MPRNSPIVSPAQASPRLLVRCLFHHALTDPKRPSLHDDSGNRIDWRNLASRVLRVAERLRVAGVRSGQRVAIAVANRYEAPILSLAIQQLGAVEVALDPGLSGAELAKYVERVEAVVLIVDSVAVARQTNQHLQQAGSRAVSVMAISDLRSPSHAPLSATELESAYRTTDHVDPSSTALILWTSGTQSNPHGVMLSHHALASNAAGKLQAVPQDSSDRRLTVLPLAHAYARTCDLGTWLLSGGTLAVTLGWDGLLKMAPIVQPTLINMVPSLALKLLRRLHAASEARQTLAEMGLADLRLLGCGGAPLSAEDFLAFRRLGILVIHGYGLTEAGPVVCSSTPHEAEPGTVGKPITGVRIRIDSDQRLWMRGPGVMQGYWGEPEVSAKKCVDGWLDTGDLARFEESGQVTILGRADDTLVLGNGRKLQPFRLERACCRLPGMRHAVLCVDEGRLVLLVDCEPSTDSMTGLDEVLAAFPPWQRPERVVRLPRALTYEQDELTAKGTVRRRKVVERWGGYHP